MRIAELAERIERLAPGRVVFKSFDRAGTEVARMEYDSRKVNGSGVIFACAKGDHVDGHDFARAAVDAGAEALLCERELPLAVPQFITGGVRAFMGTLASVLYGEPAKRMKMIGVTGTNGKTTTAYIVRSILRAAGHTAGMLGTIVYDDAQKETYADRTTPEGADVQAFLAAMAANGADSCVMEASSHGLHQGRLNGCAFDAMGFSNLTPEHLEYHSDMESYFLAKRMLFTKYAKPEWRAAVNADDEHCRRILMEFKDNCAGFSVKSCARGSYFARATKSDIQGTTIELVYPNGESRTVKTPFIGEHNVANVAEAAAIADALGISRDAAGSGIERCVQVPGRLERYSVRGGADIFVDYAHSPDGLRHVMEALRPLTCGKLIVLWGAGGERGAEKRPACGAIMGELCDFAVVTSDNPRSEDPAVIAAAVERGVVSVNGAAEHRLILDRREAIRFALDMARPGDTVLIAGKGPERTMKFADHEIPFSDAGEVSAWIADHGMAAV